MVPQWLKLGFGVKRALAVFRYVVTKHLSSSPYSAWPAQRRAKCVCVNTHTVMQVFLVGSLMSLVFPQRDCSGGYLSHG